MTVKDVKHRIEQLIAEGQPFDAQDLTDDWNDDEVAHMMEDKLYEDVLRAIAEGTDNAKELAAAVLVTKTFRFSRWYA